MNSQTASDRRSWTVRKPLVIGILAIFGLFGGVFAWAATSGISGAVLGKGKVEASGNRFAVQHPVGGIAAEILVKNGDRVSSGDVVLRLDDPALHSELDAVESELFELLANEARLAAEVENRRTLTLHPILQAAAIANPSVNALIRQQQRQLDSHFNSLSTQLSLVRTQRTQTSEEAGGVHAALAAKREELALLNEELASAQENMEKGYVTRSVVTNLQREVIKARGEAATLAAKISELRGKDSEQRLETYAAPLESRKESADTLNQSRQQSAALVAKRSALLSQLAKLDVRSPVSGTIFDSQLQGPRSVVEAAKPLMYVVPSNAPHLAIVRIEANDIEQVHVGQAAGLRFTTFNQRSTPIIDGRVSAISADVFRDEKTQTFYYFADIALTDGQLKKLGGVKLMPGMPVEAFIRTDQRSPASYVIKPIEDFFTKAFRD
jgi:HlyD family secretion protein